MYSLKSVLKIVLRVFCSCLLIFVASRTCPTRLLFAFFQNHGRNHGQVLECAAGLKVWIVELPNVFLSNF